MSSIIRSSDAQGNLETPLDSRSFSRSWRDRQPVTKVTNARPQHTQVTHSASLAATFQGVPDASITLVSLLSDYAKAQSEYAPDNTARPPATMSSNEAVTARTRTGTITQTPHFGNLMAQQVPRQRFLPRRPPMAPTPLQKVEPTTQIPEPSVEAMAKPPPCAIPGKLADAGSIGGAAATQQWLSNTVPPPLSDADCANYVAIFSAVAQVPRATVSKTGFNLSDCSIMGEIGEAFTQTKQPDGSSPKDFWRQQQVEQEILELVTPIKVRAEAQYERISRMVYEVRKWNAEFDRWWEKYHHASEAPPTSQGASATPSAPTVCQKRHEMSDEMEDLIEKLKSFDVGEIRAGEKGKVKDLGKATSEPIAATTIKEDVPVVDSYTIATASSQERLGKRAVREDAAKKGGKEGGSMITETETESLLGVVTEPEIPNRTVEGEKGD